MGDKAINKIKNTGGSWEENVDNKFNIKDTELRFEADPITAINRI